MTAKEQYKLIHRVRRIFNRIDRERQMAIAKDQMREYPITFNLKIQMPEGPVITLEHTAT